MQNTFFWHDYETFGINPRSDRPAQFAGIRTDMDLNEIGDPMMLYCKPSLDALPSPQSCMITGITPQLCDQKGVQEYEFARHIEQAFAQSNTISVGFNTIRFDDEFTRFLFWRNLIDPYGREWQNGCSRWDLIDVVRALHALRPHAIHWPYHEDGSVSFQLSQLSSVNGLTHEHAHDALSDVQATINLARLIKTVEPKFFNFCLTLRNKEQAREQMSLQSKRPILHVSGMYGAHRACLALVWPLAEHPTNKNEIIVWDLMEDPSLLSDLTIDEMKLRLFTPTTNLPDGVSRLPIKTISLNKSPFVVRDLRVLEPQRAVELNINLDGIQHHAELAKTLNLPPSLWSKVYEKQFASTDVDEDLYGAFVPNNDRPILNRLRGLNAEQLTTAHPTFEDARLEELFFRYRARNFSSSLTSDEKKRWQMICAQKCNPMLENYFQQIKDLAMTATAEENSTLRDVEAWLNYMSAYLLA